jgi:hypothetical protein
MSCVASSPANTSMDRLGRRTSPGSADEPTLRLGTRLGTRARIAPRRDNPDLGLKRRKPPVSRRFSDGETRTRTGDTTIFSREAEPLFQRRNPCKCASQRRAAEDRGSSQLRSFLADLGTETRFGAQSDRFHCTRRWQRAGGHRRTPPRSSLSRVPARSPVASSDTGAASRARAWPSRSRHPARRSS